MEARAVVNSAHLSLEREGGFEENPASISGSMRWTSMAFMKNLLKLSLFMVMKKQLFSSEHSKRRCLL